jgi:hypothetical protein
LWLGLELRAISRIVRSSPYRRSDCITFVCLIELKSASQRYLFDVCLLAAACCVRRAPALYIVASGLMWHPRPQKSSSLVAAMVLRKFISKSITYIPTRGRLSCWRRGQA